VHNLSRALDVDAKLARLEERSRHVQINDESVCDSCHARLGTKLFAMYPDDTVVCYKVGHCCLFFLVTKTQRGLNITYNQNAMFAVFPSSWRVHFCYRS
jgi:hypothetical protein